MDNKDHKIYLNTVEEIVDALQKGEAVYEDITGGNIKYKMYNGAIISEWCNGSKFINAGSIIEENNRYYMYGKKPLKFEWGKFYKTVNGEKALYYAERKDDKGNILHFFCIDKYEEFRTNALGKDVDFDNDVVDYWED